MIHAAPQLRSPARQRSRALRTEEVLAAAQEIALREGVEALTVQRLAKALSYVPAALYRYFPSKEALVAELIGRAAASAVGALSASQQRVAEVDDAGLARVLLLVESYLAWGRESPHELGLLSSAIGNPRVLVPEDAMAGTILGRAAPALGLVVGLLQDAADHALLDSAEPAPLRAVMLFASIHGSVTLKKLTRVAPGALDVDALARAHVRVLLKGFGAPPAMLKSAEALLAQWLAKGFERPPTTQRGHE